MVRICAIVTKTAYKVHQFVHNNDNHNNDNNINVFLSTCCLQFSQRAA